MTACSSSINPINEIKDEQPEVIVNEAPRRSKTIDEFETKTTNDFPSLKLNGDSFVEEGVIYYRNNNNIGHYVGYEMGEENVNTVVEFYVSFDEYENPLDYFSIEMRASDCGSVLAHPSYVTQNGYCFVLHPDGYGQIYKDHDSTPIHEFTTGPHFENGTRVLFKVGVVEENDAARLILYADGNAVVDIYDSVDPILSGGSYLNFSSWKNVSNIKARIIPTKESIESDYSTFTMSTLYKLPSRSGDVQCLDNYNTLAFSSGADSVLFPISEQNYSLEMNLNFSYFPTSGSAFYVAMRTTGYGRANSAVVGGYSFGLGNGTLYISKNGVSFLGIIYFTPLALDVDHVIEYGIVDIDENTTYLFAKINGVTIASVYDANEPRQQRGQLIMTNDGRVDVVVTSANSYTKPLKTKVKTETKYTSYDTHFYNPVSFAEGETYDEVNSINLESIYVNGYSLKELNQRYYGETLEERAFDLFLKSNVLSVKVAKSIHERSDSSEVNFLVDMIKIQKTGSEVGVRFSTGLRLKVSYRYYHN